MKNILALFAVAALATTSQAASIDWSLSLGRSAFIADSNGDPLAKGTIYLILSSGATALEDSVATDTFETTLSSIKIGEMSLNDSGKNTETVTSESGSLVASSAGGPKYTFQIVVFDAANEKYYLSSALSEYAYNSATDDATSVKFTQQMVGSAYTSANSWKPTVPVPEPSSAALVLAGLALLLKRRKA